MKTCRSSSPRIALGAHEGILTLTKKQPNGNNQLYYGAVSPLHGHSPPRTKSLDTRHVHIENSCGSKFNLENLVGTTSRRELVPQQKFENRNSSLTSLKGKLK